MLQSNCIYGLINIIAIYDNRHQHFFSLRVPLRDMPFNFSHPYPFTPEYATPVAYFSMEFGIHQPLKTYAGGLGFLAGSYLRGAFHLRQNVVGVGIAWKYGYYDQVRKADGGMDVLFAEKIYSFLQPTRIKFTISVSGHDVWVSALYLAPSVFGTAPLFLLTTDLPENDYLAKTICHKLYDANPETMIAAAVLLGTGGAKLLEQLGWQPEIFHLNESHALPLAYSLYNRYKKIDEVKKRLRFTNHTPEEGGNPKTDLRLLEKMGFFCGIPMAEVNDISHISGSMLDHTRTALRMAGKANGVSKAHVVTLEKLFGGESGLCKITSITNAQDFRYWACGEMYSCVQNKTIESLRGVKRERKKQLFEIVADQSGKIFDENTLTIVFAKRFTGYKRADLLLSDVNRFEKLVTDNEKPVQLIWAGKPYPMDYTAISVFDKIVHLCQAHSRCAVLVGYELALSKLLKAGADVWLNVPRLTHEASGTSGMAAAMNGAVNVGTEDGWYPEFVKDKVNGFVIPAVDPTLPDHQQDAVDAQHLYDVLEKEVIPLYYDYPDRWTTLMQNSMRDIIPYFDSIRMVKEYYEVLYSAAGPAGPA